MHHDLARVFVISTALLLFPYAALAQGNATASQQQGNVPAAAQQAEGAVERAVQRFGVGVAGGVGLDPELVAVGAHATFGPVFTANLAFRPGIEFGFGEVTTSFLINADVIYVLPGATGGTRWMPYVGVGPSAGLSHRGFVANEEDGDVDAEVDGVEQDVDDDRSRFDFSDTDFNGGMNFIVGARNQRGLFFEMRATAYGVSNIRLLAGFNF
jgi:hypothetical protein